MERMEKNIAYTGITQAASDLNCEDGDLSISHNIINQNGAMRPIVVPDAEFSMGVGEKLMCVHTTSNYKNFIYQTGNGIKAFAMSGGTRKDYSISYVFASGEQLYKIESIGNTLILLTTKGMYYWLFSELDYTPLGSKIPEIPINFGLTTTPLLLSDTQKLHDQKYWAFTILFDGIATSDLFNEFSESNKTQITNQVMAAVNKFINNNAVEKGQFMYPFFVRYAYRMYDGSLIQHSSPVLMNPSSGSNPVILCQPYGSNEVMTSSKADIFASPCKLDYQIMLTQAEIDELNKWKDVIRSVDIFISEPIYTFDQNGKVQSFTKVEDFFKDDNLPHLPSLTAKLPEISLPKDSPYLHRYYQKWTLWDLLSILTGTRKLNFHHVLFPPPVDKSTFNERIRDSSNFHLLSSFNISGLTPGTDGWGHGNRKEMNVSPECLRNLALKERMTDDYQTHDALVPEYSFVYNSRLNIGDVSRKIFQGLATESLSCADNGFTWALAKNEDGSNAPIEDMGLGVSRIYYTFIKENGKYIVVKNTYMESVYGDLFFYRIPGYLFYPNPNAYKIVIEYHKRTGEHIFQELKLEKHRGLNGAYFFSNFESIEPPYTTQPTVSTDCIISMPNKLYTSAVGNPFFFPLEGINTIGVGKILGMASTTRALSQGQFGQFPLLVFATDGIWAMEVSNTGLYSVKQPISRDICSNPQSITQIDGAVIFVSDKGVMAIVGSDVESISAELDGPRFDLGSVVVLDEVLEKEGLTDAIGSMVAAKDFFAGCQIAYDYPNARLVLFRSDKSYAYVYSLNARTWATMSADFVLAVSDYPNAYMQRSDNGVVNISKKIDFDAKNKVKTFMLSRPMKFDDDAYKTVNMVINRGTMDRSIGAVVVFASSDGLTYFPIGSAIGNQVSGLQGTPYRYFRIATVGSMSIKEALSISSIYYTPKWRNRGR